MTLEWYLNKSKVRPDYNTNLHITQYVLSCLDLHSSSSHHQISFTVLLLSQIRCLDMRFSDCAAYWTWKTIKWVVFCEAGLNYLSSSSTLEALRTVSLRLTGGPWEDLLKSFNKIETTFKNSIAENLNSSISHNKIYLTNSIWYCYSVKHLSYKYKNNK